MEYDDSYPTCAETYATLCIYHEDLDPEEINRLLDIDFTWSCRKGDPVSERESERAKRKRGSWLLRTEGKIESKDSRRHIDWLLDRIEDKSKNIIDLQQKGYEISIGCYWAASHGEGGPTVSPEQSQRLANLNIELTFEFADYADCEESS